MEANELIKLKEKIETAKSEKSKNEGKIEQIEKTWKEEYSCNSIEEVEKLIADNKEQIKKLETKRDSYIKEIEEKTEGLNL